MIVQRNDLLNTDIENIRFQIPSLKNIVFFNSGWTGPMPEVVFESIKRSIQNQMNLGPSSKDAVKEQIKELLDTKKKIASFFFTSSENVCLTTSTTMGINIALNAYNWDSEDEIIATKNEHASVIIPLYNLKERFNVNIKLIDVDINNPLESIRKNLTKKTRAVVFCHVFWTNGYLMPVSEIVQMLKEKDIITIIDAAQSAGALEINLDEINSDFYCVPGQKWLLGPLGTGFLYVNKALFGKRPPWPSIVGYESAGDAGNDELYDLNFGWHPKKNAGVFEFGGMNNSLFSGLSSAISFASENQLKFDVYGRIFSLAQYLVERLAENKNIEVLTTKNHAGLVSWRHKHISSTNIISRLWNDKRILIREISNRNICRASVHYFNTKKEIDYLLESLT